MNKSFSTNTKPTDTLYTKHSFKSAEELKMTVEVKNN